MQGIDHGEAFWLAVGSARGKLINGEAAYNGADAWSLGDETTQYLCNPSSHRGIKAQGMVFRRGDDGSDPVWAPLSRRTGRIGGMSGSKIRRLPSI